ncbi:MAG TPA: MBL fold metallo-hydrolase RNA specificity domain-containing protein, partial [Tepidiformaceae bacterium]|nr:MBL fold metallo-hydrolase RNA specificity domain-containing protein [Tepidiformaceae bacterium]
GHPGTDPGRQRARLVGDDKNLLVLVGYQAAGTRGRRLLEGQRTMRIHGQDIPVNCHWISVDGLSAHADEEGLVEWVKSAAHKPATIFLAHGEPDAADALAARLTAAGYHPVVPQLDQEYEFIPSSRHWRQA